MNLYWLGFDLTIRGPYDKLYTFLDELGAKACTPELAFFKSEMDKDQFVEYFNKYFMSTPFEYGSIIYLIHINKEGKAIGTFLTGNRKRSPWSGYADEPTEVDGDD